MPDRASDLPREPHPRAPKRCVAADGNTRGPYPAELQTLRYIGGRQCSPAFASARPKDELGPTPASGSVAHTHPPRAFGKAGVAVSGHPVRKSVLVLRFECSEPRHRLFRCLSMSGRSGLRVEAPEPFVALGTPGVQHLQHTPRPHKRAPRALGLVRCLMSLVANPFGDALPCELGPVVELERDRHFEPMLELLGPLRVVGCETVPGPLDPDDTGADILGERLRPGPVLGVAHLPGCDWVGDEGSDGLEDGVGRAQCIDTTSRASSRRIPRRRRRTPAHRITSESGTSLPE